MIRGPNATSVCNGTIVKLLDDPYAQGDGQQLRETTRPRIIDANT